MKKDLEQLKGYLIKNNNSAKAKKVARLIEISEDPTRLKKIAFDVPNLSGTEWAAAGGGALLGAQLGESVGEYLGLGTLGRTLSGAAGGALGGYLGSYIPGAVSGLIDTYSHHDIDPAKSFEQKVLGMSDGKNIFETQDWLYQPNNTRYYVKIDLLKKPEIFSLMIASWGSNEVAYGPDYSTITKDEAVDILKSGSNSIVSQQKFIIDEFIKSLEAGTQSAPEPIRQPEPVIPPEPEPVNTERLPEPLTTQETSPAPTRRQMNQQVREFRRRLRGR